MRYIIMIFLFFIIGICLSDYENGNYKSNAEIFLSNSQLNLSNMLSIKGGCSGGSCVVMYGNCAGSCYTLEVQNCDGGAGYCEPSVLWMTCYCGSHYWEIYGCY